MDTNFYGCLRTMKGVLPSFREAKGGTIVNVSSGAGLVGRPSRALYAASKFALEGASEAISHEIAPFNIRMIIADLGAYNTSISSNVVVPAKGVNDAYKDGPAGKLLNFTQQMGSMNFGDPSKAALRILEMVTKTGMASNEMVRGCLRLILGGDCLDAARDKMKSLGENLDAMEAIARSTSTDE